eukprot:ANDGO_06443.mRNA.1 Protein UXT homolog
MMSPQDRYRAHLTTELLPELERLIRMRDKLYEDLSPYLDLRTQLRVHTESADPGRSGEEQPMLIDIGSRVFVEARVSSGLDAGLFVHVGFGFHVQMSVDEALAFIVKKEEDSMRRAETVAARIASVRAQCRLVEDALRDAAEL